MATTKSISVALRWSLTHSTGMTRSFGWSCSTSTWYASIGGAGAGCRAPFVQGHRSVYSHLYSGEPGRLMEPVAAAVVVLPAAGADGVWKACGKAPPTRSAYNGTGGAIFITLDNIL